MLYGQVSIDPEIMSGTPVFAGTRVPVQNLFDYIEGGEDLTEFLDDFPSVCLENLKMILEQIMKFGLYVTKTGWVKRMEHY